MDISLMTVLPLVVLASAVAAFYIIRYLRLRKNRLRRLASSLGREDLDSGVTYEGEQDDHKFYYEYFTGSKNRPSHFRVWLQSPSPGGFRIGPEGRLDAFFKRLGIAVEIQTGDSEFDHRFYVRTDYVPSTRHYLDRPEIREAIKRIRRLGFTEINHDGKTLEAKISPFRLSDEITELDAASVVGELVRLSEDLPGDSLERRVSGMPAWKFRRNTVYAVNTLVAGSGLGLLLWGLNSYTPLHAFEIFRYSAGYSFPLLLLAAVVMVYMLKGRSSSHTDLLVNLAIAAIGLPLAGFGAATVANGYLDHSDSNYHDARVMGKHYSSSRNSTNYYVSLKSWNPGSGREEIRVSRSVYRRVRAGESVMTVTSRPGYLGFEWIVDYRISR